MKVVVLRGTARRTCPRGQGGGEGCVAAVGSGGQWAIINVSASVAHQLQTRGDLPGAPGIGRTGVRAVVLCDAQLERAAGLLGLRHGAPIDLYATPAVFEELTVQLAVLPALQHYCGVHWRVVPVAGDLRLAAFRIDGLPTLEFTALAVDGRVLPHAAAQRPVTGDRIALTVHDLVTGRRVFCAPGPIRPDGPARAFMQACDCLLLDEPPDQDDPRAGDWIDWLERLPARHKLMVGGADARAARALAQRGIAMARGGLTIDL